MRYELLLSDTSNATSSFLSFTRGVQFTNQSRSGSEIQLYNSNDATSGTSAWAPFAANNAHAF